MIKYKSYLFPLPSRGLRIFVVFGKLGEFVVLKIYHHSPHPFTRSLDKVWENRTEPERSTGLILALVQDTTVQSFYVVNKLVSVYHTEVIERPRSNRQSWPWTGDKCIETSCRSVCMKYGCGNEESERQHTHTPGIRLLAQDNKAVYHTANLH